jgi:hypothetical protein
MQAYINKVLEFYVSKDLRSIESGCDVDIFCMLSSDNGQSSYTESDTGSISILIDLNWKP